MTDSGYDTKYCYPNSNVLKNRLGLKSNDILFNAEREYSSMRLYELASKPIRGNFDLQHLQKVHKYIFQDIYDWAGQIRTVEIAKGNMFCSCNYISSYSEQIFQTLEKDKYLLGLSKGKTIEKLAYYLGEINALHPFREGNGRTQREFITSLAGLNGYDLIFNQIDEKQMIEASISSFNCIYEPMQKLIQSIITPLSRVEHKEYVDYLLENNSKLTKTFNKYIKDAQLER